MLRRIGIACLMLAATAGQVQAAMISLSSVKDGRNGNGGWSASNDYSRGVGSVGFRSFDLSAITGTIISAKLLLPGPNRGSSGVTVQLWDVSTAVTYLGTNAGPGTGNISLDLRTGTSFGAFVYDANDVNEVNLDSAAVSNLNASIGGHWSVGIYTPDPYGIAGGSFGYGNNGGFLELATAEPVPEPASLAVWSMIGGIGFMARRRRKRS